MQLQEAAFLQALRAQNDQGNDLLAADSQLPLVQALRAAGDAFINGVPGSADPLPADHAGFNADGFHAERADMWQAIYEAIRGDDEEARTDGVVTSYRFQFVFVTDDNSSPDHVYFNLDENTGEMRFKSADDFIAQGLQLKPAGQSYKVKVRVIDTGTEATELGQRDVSGEGIQIREQGFVFTVRNFDFDWTPDDDTSFVDSEKKVTYAADTAVRQEVGGFVVLLDREYSYSAVDKFTFSAPTNTAWGEIEVEQDPNNKNQFTVFFTPNPDDPDVKALALRGDAHEEPFIITVNVAPAGLTDSNGNQIVFSGQVPVRVVITGVNDAPDVKGSGGKDSTAFAKDYHGKVQEAWVRNSSTRRSPRRAGRGLPVRRWIASPSNGSRMKPRSAHGCSRISTSGRGSATCMSVPRIGRMPCGTPALSTVMPATMPTGAVASTSKAPTAP